MAEIYVYIDAIMKHLVFLFFFFFKCSIVSQLSTINKKRPKLEQKKVVQTLKRRCLPYGRSSMTTCANSTIAE